jgi:uncharacterized protein YfaQ (DUF2300 family)
MSQGIALEDNTQLIARVMSLNGQIVDSLNEDKSTPTIPLGSLWKLFVFSYLTEEVRTDSDYVCKGANPEEIFCCSPGESIQRDLALAKSCSPYFSPERLSIGKNEWKKFWIDHQNSSFTWLTNLALVKPETKVNANELLIALINIKKTFKNFKRIEAATVGTVIEGTASNSLKTWGSTLRVKTYTWRDSSTKDLIDGQGFTGGFAGWLPDGSAILVSQAGHGKDAFKENLKSIVQKHLSVIDAGCVSVKYFDRYPIKSITPSSERPLGPTTIKFENGKELKFHADGNLRVSNLMNKITLTATLSTNEYVARVLQREVELNPIDATRAFAIAIRTYLAQNSKKSEGCDLISDSSHNQRVSPSPASPKALEIAKWTEGLVLERVNKIRYHSTKDSLNQMSWFQAKKLATSGYSMVEILKTAYPSGVIVFEKEINSLSCTPNIATEKWIQEQSKQWIKKLINEPGFEKPIKLKVCQNTLSGTAGHLFSILESQEIYVPKLKDREDEISVLHEYLHIAFKDHPKGRNEKFIEHLALSVLEEI